MHVCFKSTALAYLLVYFQVDTIVIGGPAYGAKSIQKGDTVRRVDGKAVTAENVSSLLSANDTPGRGTCLCL